MNDSDPRAAHAGEPVVASGTTPITPSARWRWLLCLLAAGAMVISAMLAVQAYAGLTLPGCGADGTLDCDSVLATRWGRWFNLPVSLPAMALYLTALIALQGTTSPREHRRRWAWRVLIVLSVAILAAAAWFVGIQIYLQKFCLYCMAAHALGTTLGGLILFHAPHDLYRRGSSKTPAEPLISRSSLAGLILLAGGATLMLPVGQWMSVGHTHAVQQTLGGVDDFDTGPQAGLERSMSILRGQVRLRPHDHPYIGPQDARHVLVYLYDYTCPSCRLLHRQFKDAIARHPGQLGIVKLVTPMGHACNPHVKQTRPIHAHACELATLALAVWQADQRLFEPFDDWLNQGDDPPTPQAARDKAVELVGQAALDAALREGDIAGRLESHLTVYGMTGGSVVPQFIMGPVVVFSLPSPDQLETLFQTHLGLAPALADAGDPISRAD